MKRNKEGSTTVKIKKKSCLRTDVQTCAYVCVCVSSAAYFCFEKSSVSAATSFFVVVLYFALRRK